MPAARGKGQLAKSPPREPGTGSKWISAKRIYCKKERKKGFVMKSFSNTFWESLKERFSGKNILKNDKIGNYVRSNMSPVYFFPVNLFVIKSFQEVWGNRKRFQINLFCEAIIDSIKRLTNMIEINGDLWWEINF